MAYGACANDMRSSRDALAKSRFPGAGKGLNVLYSCTSPCTSVVGRNGLKLTTSDDYFSKDLSDRGHEASRGGAGQRAGIQK